MFQMTGFLALLSLSTAAFAQGPVAEPLQPLCHVLERLTDFNGRSIRIRARTDGLFLIATECPSHIRIGEVEFPNELAMEWPDSLVVQRLIQVPFPVDRSSARALERALANVHEVYATVQGIIIT